MSNPIIFFKWYAAVHLSQLCYKSKAIAIFRFYMSKVHQNAQFEAYHQLFSQKYLKQAICSFFNSFGNVDYTAFISSSK